MGQSVIRNPRKIHSQSGGDPSLPSRVTVLENNEYKVTYYEIISGASGSITIPTGATINAGEFGLSGNCILSKIDGSNKPTFESPKTAGGVVVTASLNESTGTWVASGTYTDASVALIYSIKIKAINYSNLTYANIIETVELTDFPISQSITNGITNKAPSEDAVFDALALKKDHLTLYFLGGILSPADNTSYYFTRLSPTITETSQDISLGYNGKVVGAIIMAHGNTVSGSAENATIQFRNVTQGTSSVISSTVLTNGSSTNIVTQTVTGLSIDFLGTDTFTIQYDSPAYATNPANFNFTIYLTIEKTN